MRIVLAHKYFYRGGGTATYLFALMEELQKRGHECIPFTVAYEQTVPREYWDYYVSPPAGSSTTHLKDMRLSPWDMVKLLGRATWSTEAYRKALRLVDELKPDIAYVHNLYSYMSPSPIAAFKKRGLPIVMRVADYNMVCPELHLFRHGEPCTECVDHGLGRALRFRCHKRSLQATAARVVSMYAQRLSCVYEAVDLFVTPSGFMREVLIRAGYPEDRIVHIPSFYPAAVEKRAAVEKGYVLCFGRVAREKGLNTLVEALALLQTDVPVLVAGADVDGETARLQGLAEASGVHNLQFVGMKQRTELDELIDGALFTVVPSRWYDNCPMSVLESFARAKPVIGADIGGIPEQITPDAGLLFRPRDADDLASKMGLLLSDSTLRRSLGAGAQQRVATNDSADAHCGRLLDLLECSTRGRQRPR